MPVVTVAGFDPASCLNLVPTPATTPVAAVFTADAALPIHAPPFFFVRLCVDRVRVDCCLNRLCVIYKIKIY